MYVCSCFGVTEDQVREHKQSGCCTTPRQIAAACGGAGTDCGGCVRRIQALLDRGSQLPRPVPRMRRLRETAVVPVPAALVAGAQESGSSEAIVAA